MEDVATAIFQAAIPDEFWNDEIVSISDQFDGTIRCSDSAGHVLGADYDLSEFVAPPKNGRPSVVFKVNDDSDLYDQEGDM